MTQALFKPASKDNHTYESEGLYYFYQVCDESEVDEFVKQGWETEFTKLKGEDHESKEQKQEVQQKANEEVLDKPKRGRKPKAE